MKKIYNKCLLDCVYKYFNKWKFKINYNKTMIIYIHTLTRHTRQLSCIYRTNDIDLISVYKYLGIIFDKHLDFHLAAGLLACAV